MCWRTKKVAHKYGSNMPLAREYLKSIIRSLKDNDDRYHAAWVFRALMLLHQSPPIRVTPVRNPPPTDEQRAAVLHLANTTTLSQQDIAVKTGTNAGRVSEILRGN